MKIAIKANPKKGKEIISLLESLGSTNTILSGDGELYTYYIDDNNVIRYGDAPKNYKVYTLEEFETQFPFKIGDLCIYQSEYTGDVVVKVLRMIIQDNDIVYEIGHKDTDKTYSGIYRRRDTLKPYKEMKKERNVTLTLEKAKEWYKKGGELKEIALQAFSETELNPLPRSWEEFCKQGNPVTSWRYSIPTKYEALYQLERLRDCYRGLFVTVIGMPIWNISMYNGKPHIFQAMWGKNHSFLSFQSKEVAEEYLKNFKPLIEKARDLI